MKLPLSMDSCKVNGVVYYQILDADGDVIFDTYNSDTEELRVDGDHQWDEIGRQNAYELIRLVNSQAESK